MTIHDEPTHARVVSDEHSMAVEILSSKWSIPVLAALAEGPARRMHLKRRALGINDDRLDTALARHLRWGLITRDWVAGPRNDEPGYAITPLGRSLLVALEPLASWQRRHHDELDQRRQRWDTAHPSRRP